MGNGILAIWMDCAAEGEADFNEWYHREHFPERVGVPGFLKGRALPRGRGRPGLFHLVPHGGCRRAGVESLS